jgi:glycosyltransferase involved in cell wall biosynthesis
MLLRDFAEDRRTSMEIYADRLHTTLESVDQNQFSFTAFQPQLPPWNRALPETANLKMRAARYIAYPRQAKRFSADIYHIIDHGYAHLLSSLDPSKCIVTVHDMIPFLAGRGLIPGVTMARRSWLNEYSLGFLKRAAAIVAVSENTKQDLLRYCQCAPERIHVLANGVEPAFKKLDASKTQLREDLGLPRADGAKLVLITGQQFYKNHETCLAVLERLVEHFGNDVYLVRLSPVTPDWRHRVEHCGCAGQIIEIPMLPASSMPSLYNAVDCLLFPSWYEGFGWPPLEAMACGTPVVASNAGSLPEVVGSAATQCDPHDVAGLAAAVIRLWQDQAFASAQIHAGFENCKRFDWRRYGQDMFGIYQSVVGTLGECHD